MSGITIIVINAGIDSVKLSKSIFKIGDIIKKPTKINAGAVAAAGTMVKTGAKKRATKNRAAVDNDVNPVFPPSATPEALST